MKLMCWLDNSTRLELLLPNSNISSVTLSQTLVSGPPPSIPNWYGIRTLRVLWVRDCLEIAWVGLSISNHILVCNIRYTCEVMHIYIRWLGVTPGKSWIWIILESGKKSVRNINNTNTKKELTKSKIAFPNR